MSAIFLLEKEIYTWIGNLVESSTTRFAHDALNVRDSDTLAKFVVSRNSARYALKLSTVNRT